MGVTRRDAGHQRKSQLSLLDKNQFGVAWIQMQDNASGEITALLQQFLHRFVGLIGGRKDVVRSVFCLDGFQQRERNAGAPGRTNDIEQRYEWPAEERPRTDKNALGILPAPRNKTAAFRNSCFKMPGTIESDACRDVSAQAERQILGCCRSCPHPLTRVFAP